MKRVRFVDTFFGIVEQKSSDISLQLYRWKPGWEMDCEARMLHPSCTNDRYG